MVKFVGFNFVLIISVVFSSTLIPLGTVYTPDSILGSIIKHVYYTPTSWGRQGCQLKADVMKDLEHH